MSDVEICPIQTNDDSGFSGSLANKSDILERPKMSVRGVLAPGESNFYITFQSEGYWGYITTAYTLPSTPNALFFTTYADEGGLTYPPAVFRHAIVDGKITLFVNGYAVVKLTSVSDGDYLGYAESDPLPLTFTSVSNYIRLNLFAGLQYDIYEFSSIPVLNSLASPIPSVSPFTTSTSPVQVSILSSPQFYLLPTTYHTVNGVVTDTPPHFYAQVTGTGNFAQTSGGMPVMVTDQSNGWTTASEASRKIWYDYCTGFLTCSNCYSEMPYGGVECYANPLADLSSEIATVFIAGGPRGLQGVTGSQGPTGIQGIRGERGMQGDVGPRGPQGEGFSWTSPGAITVLALTLILTLIVLFLFITAYEGSYLESLTVPAVGGGLIVCLILIVIVVVYAGSSD
jgi:hypothetical protein